MNYLKEFKNKKIFVILLTFSLAGFSIVQIRRLLFGLLAGQPATVKWVIYACILFPLYQVLLLFFSWCLGEYGFFKSRQQKILKRLGLIWKSKKDSLKSVSMNQEKGDKN